MGPRKERCLKLRATVEGAVSFEPRDIDNLRRFFEDSKDRYHELWVVLTKKKFVAQ